MEFEEQFEHSHSLDDIPFYLIREIRLLNDQ